tara:strand:- start:31151 stop:31822 length:672 start_codon:yes stop_codon:yes gene_type:complete
MTYPNHKFVQKFLENHSGILGKDYIECLIHLYGDSLARLTFIRALQGFDNYNELDRVTARPESLGYDFGSTSHHPFAVISAAGASQIQTSFYELGPYGTACTKSVLLDPNNIHPGRVEIGLAVLQPEYPSRHATRRECFEDPTYREGAWSLYNRIRERFIEEGIAESYRVSGFPKFRDRYFDKTYDLLLNEDYTETSALVSALSADPVLSADNWRNWTASPLP